MSYPIVEQKISQSAFARLLETMMAAANRGHGADAVVRMGLLSIGLEPKEYVETKIVIDPRMDGPIFPFAEWPAELAAKREQQ